jgi:hypothetical protein
MSKLSLKIEELEVESFETSRDEPARGTVMAHETGTFPQIICGCTYDVGTCDYTCGAGCGGTGTGTGTGPSTRDYTCATGNQIICECAG